MRDLGFSQDADDAAHEYVVRLLEGRARRQTAYQFTTDYLRANFTPRGFMQDARRRNFTQPEPLTERTTDELGGGLRPDSRDNLYDCLRALERDEIISKRDAEILIKNIYHGETMKKLAKEYNLSKGRIDAIIRTGQQKLKIEYSSCPLSRAEVRVARLIIKYAHTNKEAALKLEISEKGVKFHLTNIFRKLKIKSRAELTNLYWTEKLPAALIREINFEPKPEFMDQAETNKNKPLPGAA
jgi:DNA-binding CsgD family transcriptional regulator